MSNPAELPTSDPMQHGRKHALPAVIDDEPVSPAEPQGGDDVMKQIEELPPEVGWLLVYVGVLGFALPGITGAPFLVVGVGVISPRGRKYIARWIGKDPPRFVRAGVHQIVRMVDDLDRRYPLLPKKNGTA